MLPWKGKGAWAVPLGSIGVDGYVMVDDVTDFIASLAEKELRIVKKAAARKTGNEQAARALALAAVRWSAHRQS